MIGQSDLLKRRKSQGLSQAFVTGSAMLVASMGIVTPAFAITNGTYVSGTVYNNGPLPYTYAKGSTGSPSTIDYTNGVSSSTGSTSDPANTSVSATSTASLATDQLSLSLSGSNTYTSATAEMWDTLTFAGLPSGGNVTANTVLGILTMTVTGSIGTATYGTNGYAGYGLSLYDASSFATNQYGGGCGYTDGMTCSGLLASNGLGSTLFTPGTQTFTIDVTPGDLSNGSLAFIAEIYAGNYSDPSLNAPLIIDPTITLTGLYQGVTVTTSSGYSYTGVSAVPEPETYAMLLAGLGLIGFIAYRRKNNAPYLMAAA